MSKISNPLVQINDSMNIFTYLLVFLKTTFA